MSTYANLFKNKIVVLAMFIGAALILFSPSTGRIFLSDDYCTLHNIVSDNSIWMKSFFRPVGDLTLMWNYKLSGWNPFYFYLTNILLHAVNSFLLYLFCTRWHGPGNRYILFAVGAGVIFLTYPSHSEAILWAIGRGISLAVFFSLLAMITVIADIQSALKYIITGILYFIALACYESVLLLPVILLFLAHRDSKKAKRPLAIVLVSVMCVHLLLRYFITGGIWKAYNGVIFAKDIIEYFTTFFKIMLRMFIPPFDNPFIFTLCGVAAFIVLLIILYRSRKRIETDSIFYRTLLLVAVGILATVLVALSFGLSTRTSEGDRLMYFPSVFYAILISLLAVRLMRTLRWALLAVALFAVMQSGFLIINQRHWNKASDMAVKILNGIVLHPQRPLYVINLPSDHAGAFVFRNCLPEALLHFGVDTASVKIVNIIQSTDIEKKKGEIVHETIGVQTFIWPETLLEMKNDSVVSIKTGTDSVVAVSAPSSSFLYWNKNDLVPLVK